ncbi:acylphosphatase [Sphingobium lignivorans]|uniref:acylphosphatase n=1 Tax=Sphingobium lignivorans TaxID=2735886 RepID=A0ABR6NFK2_9SPHN|nr:acylphosphatase [Sphingobium lignivorans]MBB5985851.1 acylphosphatase [Sphingobium lignivorans]
MAFIAKHIRITGRVQGVFYRGWTVATARKLGLAGWVRNRLDGSVEAFVQGEDGQVEHFLMLARSGPPAAQVDAVRDSPASPGDHHLFEQRPTA